MSSIVANQKSAFLARATDDARRLADSLQNLSEPQRAAILAIVASKAQTPVDIVMLGEPGDWNEARQAIHGLRLDSAGRWEINSGCHLVVEELPR